MKIKNNITQSYPDYEQSWLFEDVVETKALPACGLIAVRNQDGTVHFYDDEYPALTFHWDNHNENQ